MFIICLMDVKVFASPHCFIIPRNIQDSVFIFNLQLDKMLKFARCFSTFSHLYNNNIPKVNTAILNFSTKNTKVLILTEK